MGQYIEQSQQFTPPDNRVTAVDLIGTFKLAARQGFALGVWGKDTENLGTVFVVRRGDRPEFRRLLALATRPDAAPDPVQKAGRAIHALNQDLLWWIEKGDLVLSNQPDAVLAVLDGKELGSADHPLRTALLKANGGFEPAAVGFLDFTKLPPMSAEAVRLGLDGVKRIEFVWGFEGDAMRTVLRAVAPAPRRGLLALLDQPTFDLGTLPPMPAALTGFTVLSIDLARTFDQVTKLLRTADANGPDRVAMTEDAIRQQFGFDLRKDLIAGFGPKLALYVQAPAAGDVGGPNRAAKMLAGFSGLTISAQVRDQAALSRAIDPLMKVANLVLQQGGGPAPVSSSENSRPLVRCTYWTFPPGCCRLRLRRCSGRRSSWVMISLSSVPRPPRPRSRLTSPDYQRTDAGNLPGRLSRWRPRSPRI